MARRLGGVVAGFAVAFVVVLAVEILGMQVFPQPAAMDPTNADSVRQFLDQIHPGSFVFVLVAWTLAAFFGPVVARRVAGERPKWPAVAVAVLFGAACAYNLVTVPSPSWMIPAAVVLVGAASMLGLRSNVLSRA